MNIPEMTDEQISAFLVNDNCYEGSLHGFARAILAARDAQYAAQVQEPVEWMPIETAPRNGTSFWAFSADLIDLDFNPQGAVECAWNGDDFIGCVWNGHQDFWYGTPIKPTHWMPLPAAPGVTHPAPTNPAAQEPVARVNAEGFIVETGLLIEPGTLLYTHPYVQSELDAAAERARDLVAGLNIEDAPATQERAEPVAPAVGERNIHHSELLIEMWPPRPTKGMIVGMSKGVKITHKPTGLYVTCDSERSQHANRDKAYEQLCIVLSATPPAPAQPEPSMRERLQKQCSAWGTYWRASDAHGVELTLPQAVELLQDALGVEVEIKHNGCTTCDGSGMIGGPSYYSPDEGGVPCPDCAAPVAQPSPNPSKPEQAEAPSDAELNELAQHHTWFNGSHAMTNYPAFARAAIARWGATLPPASAAGERDDLSQWEQARFGYFDQAGRFVEFSGEDNELPNDSSPRWVGGLHDMQLLRAALAIKPQAEQEAP